MSPIFLVGSYSLRAILRSSFFWIWGLVSLLLTLSLYFISFFDFSGTSLPELFLATLVLFGTVSAMAFQLSGSRDFDGGQWGVLLTRPVSSDQLIHGRLFAFTLTQVGIGVLLLTFFLIELKLLGRGIGYWIWIPWFFALMQIGALAALYGLITIWMSDFWALVSMVGAFLGGQLAPNIHSLVPEKLSFLSSIPYVALPDLDLEFINVIGRSDGNMYSTVAWKTVYYISYYYIIVYISSRSLAYRINRK